MNTYMHFLVWACLFSMQPDCPSIYWLLGRWRDAQKYKSISVNVAHGFSNCARARKKKAAASATGWPPGAFKSYFAYSVSQKHTRQISLMSHTKPHDGKNALGCNSEGLTASGNVTGFHSAGAGGGLQTRLTVIGMGANVGLRCRLESVISWSGVWFVWISGRKHQPVGFSCLRGRSLHVK